MALDPVMLTVMKIIDNFSLKKPQRPLLYQAALWAWAGERTTPKYMTLLAVSSLTPGLWLQTPPLKGHQSSLSSH